MNGAQATIETLRRFGTRYIFGLPGTTVMPLLDALYDEKEIRYIGVRHEQVAAFMADGYARASGQAGVCMASRGPGAANLAIGVYNAQAESVPLVAIIGQVGDGISYRNAFEEVDLLTFYRPITKWQVEVHRPERIPELVGRAVHAACSGRPGAVLVSLPLDVQVAQGNFSFPDPWPVARPVAPKAEIATALNLLFSAERPVILAGGGVSTSRAQRPLQHLAELLSAPVITTWLRKDIFPNDSPLFLGAAGPEAVAATWEAIAAADVILAVGCRFSEFATKRWEAVPRQARLIHLDVDPAEIGKVYPPAVALPGDARLTLEYMLAMAREIAGPEPTGQIRERREWAQALRQSYLAATTLPETGQDVPVPSAALVRALENLTREDNILFVQDAATFGAWMQRYVAFRPGTLFAPAGGSLGWGLGAAMGIKLARPQATVINIMGDGAFFMVVQDLETAVRENIPVVTVIANNFCYGNTRERQKTGHGGRFIGVWHGNPDFARLATLVGAYGQRVERASELPDALRRAIASRKPAVVDVIQDRWEGLPPGAVPAAAR